MASFFIIGEKKVRPGVYFRYENYGTPPVAGADDGNTAVTLRSNWGPVGDAVLLESDGDIAKMFGDGGANGTTKVALEQFKGGAITVRAVRVGNGGTRGSYDIKVVVNPSEEGWYETNGSAYARTEDTAVQTGKTYYTMSYAYSAATGTEDTDPSEEGWYERSGNTYLPTADTSMDSEKTYYTRTAIYTAVTDDGSTVLRLLLKYPGSRELSIAIRPTLDDPAVTELLILEDTEQLERLTFDNTENNVEGLLAAFKENGSKYFTLTKLRDSASALAVVTQAAITPGTDPIVTNASYSAAFEILEAYRWNVASIDTEDTGVQSMFQLFLNRIYKDGAFCQGVIGQPTSVDFETRLRQASAYNDYQLVYVGNGFTDINGDVYEGYMAAARIAGMVAGTPSNESITHTAVTQAVDLTEKLTNNQYTRAIKAGMLTFSVSSANTVWVEQGVNTLVLPGQKEDEGWKKIKRVKVRFELFQRLNDTVEGLVGNIPNDPDGRATVIQVSNGVCSAMVSERKLLAGAHVEEDPDNRPEGDSAWFLVYADDIDALEKLYYAFKFRFAPEDTE